MDGHGRSVWQALQMRLNRRAERLAGQALQGVEQAARGPLPIRLNLPGFGGRLKARGCSSDGRALQSHCRGQGFDSPQLHQPGALKMNDFFD